MLGSQKRNDKQHKGPSASSSTPPGTTANKVLVSGTGISQVQYDIASTERELKAKALEAENSRANRRVPGYILFNQFREFVTSLKDGKNLSNWSPDTSESGTDIKYRSHVGYDIFFRTKEFAEAETRWAKPDEFKELFLQWKVGALPSMRKFSEIGGKSLAIKASSMDSTEQNTAHGIAKNIEFGAIPKTTLLNPKASSLAPTINQSFHN